MKFKYNHEKNAKLLAQRNIGFDEIIQCIADSNLLSNTNHRNKDYLNQKIIHV